MRSRANILTRIWDDDHFVAQSTEAKVLYFFLLSQPKLTLVGQLDFMPNRWAKKNPGMDVDAVLDELERNRYVLIDRDESELVIRTLVKNDPAKQWQAIKGMWNAWETVGSHSLRVAIVAELMQVPDEEAAIWTDKRVAVPAAALAIREWLENHPIGTCSTANGTETLATNLATNLTVEGGPDGEATGPVNPPADLALGREARARAIPRPSTQYPENTLSSLPVPLQAVSPNGDGSALVRVFEAWRFSVGKPRSVLDEKRKRIIRGALKNYPEADLIDAVKGWKHSPHHRGENDRRTIYNDLELLLKDAKNIEKFRDLERQPLTKRAPTW